MIDWIIRRPWSRRHPGLANLQHGTNRFGQKVEGFGEAFYSRADVAKPSKISVAQVQFAKRVIAGIAWGLILRGACR